MVAHAIAGSPLWNVRVEPPRGRVVDDDGARRREARRVLLGRAAARGEDRDVDPREVSGRHVLDDDVLPLPIHELREKAKKKPMLLGLARLEALWLRKFFSVIVSLEKIHGKKKL